MSLTSEDLQRLLRETGALMEGHFLLTSGLHSPLYVEKFRLLERPEVTAQLGRALADRFRNEGVELVAGPAYGGILLAHETAKALGTKAIFTERVEGRMVFRRGFAEHLPGQRVLVVEDIVTTGGSVREVLEAVQAGGGKVVGVGLLVDRSGGQVNLGVKTEALTTLHIPTYPPDECPLCRQGTPLVKPGSRPQR